MASRIVGVSAESKKTAGQPLREAPIRAPFPKLGECNLSVCNATHAIEQEWQLQIEIDAGEPSAFVGSLSPIGMIISQ
ncbi:hypothetical protein [Kaistia terrae]|uniref:Uncharacterized protein n=1 Tax=Kaistia terrae TaxID=537017 RepID=A0ABW0PTN1_9HYPH|nr:hypothetical protein [Kaistia terrae]MCX5577032.1 hypothetical protein [Kaistia terrae]